MTVRTSVAVKTCWAVGVGGHMMAPIPAAASPIAVAAATATRGALQRVILVVLISLRASRTTILSSRARSRAGGSVAVLAAKAAMVSRV
ncbi:Uncharacterised protein [Mycobacteroides abscessus subsp. abscessus]|nr:Uncharacterised protein [Mycobacteroides abscessus subsp. abscessus]